MKVFSSLLFLFSSLFAFENSVGTTGYGRVQTSFENNKENVCFKAPGAGTKYRLGNECETWLELAVFQDIKLDNGINIHNQVRPIFTGKNEENVDLLRWEEIYSEISNIFDNSASLWVGRRYYKRYDSFTSDYFFFNMSGTGAGINNIDLDAVKLSYSYMFENLDPRTADGGDRVLYQSHDMRVDKELERGLFTLFLNYMILGDKTFTPTQRVESVDGYAAGLMYTDKQITQELFDMKGENISGIFYGAGAAKGAGANSPYLQEALIDTMLTNNKSVENSKTIRFINYNTFENDTFGIMSNMVYEQRDDADFSNTKQNWFSVGVRPSLFISEYVRFVFEAGYDNVHDITNDTSYALYKGTTALEFAMAKGLSQRPVLRLFYTKASWNESAKGLVGTDFYADKTSGDNLGIQLEYWW
ncbi:MAG: carbohydrate porin [Sulfurimonas sp.]|jgi:maltoporin